MIKDIDRIEKSILELHERRDKIMDLSRKAIMLTGKSITAMHAGKLPYAKELLDESVTILSKINTLEKGMEFYSLQCHQEVVEARLIYHIIKEGRIPGAEELGEGELPYLLGLLDCVGELKREAFESMRKNEADKAMKYYEIMLDIYDSTLPLRFASSLVPDFRKKQDVARIQLESTSNALLFHKPQKKNQKRK